MSVTIRRVSGPRKVVDLQWVCADVQFDSNYAALGEPLSASDLGFDAGSKMFALEASPVLGLLFGYDFANSKLRAYSPIDSSKPFAYTPGGGDIKGATSVTGAMGTADQAADVVNAGQIAAYMTGTAIDGAAQAMVVTDVLDCSRNLVVSIKNDQGGGTPGNLPVGEVATVTIVGTFRGAAQTEAISYAVADANKVVADTKFRAFAGAKPFDAVTTVTVLTPATFTHALKIGVGPGVLFGLPIVGDTGANADVAQFTVKAAKRAVGSNFDWTNQTFNTGTLADGDDVSLIYNVDYDVPGGSALGSAQPISEVPATTDLSTVTTRVFAWAGR